MKSENGREISGYDNNNIIIGKILSSKLIHRNSFNSALANIWCDPSGIKIYELEPDLFRISMDNPLNVKIILKGNP